MGRTPVIAADWETDDSDDRWNMPVALGVFKIHFFGKMSIKMGADFSGCRQSRALALTPTAIKVTESLLLKLVFAILLNERQTLQDTMFVDRSVTADRVLVAGNR